MWADELCIGCLGQWPEVRMENSKHAGIFLRDPVYVSLYRKHFHKLIFRGCPRFPGTSLIRQILRTELG